MECEYQTTHIPKDILAAEIFPKLRCQDILACKGTCRSLRNAVTTMPRMSKNMVLTMQSEEFLLLDFDRRDHFYCVAEFMLPNSSTPILLQQLVTFQFATLNACNGLLCVSRYPSEDFTDVAMHIANPITPEYLTLPGRTDTRRGLHTDLCGLGFCPRTRKFKAFRLSYPLFSDERNPVEELRRQSHTEYYQVEVLTLGTDTAWRNIGPARNYRCSGKAVWGPFKAFLNGSLHRIIHGPRGLEISAFNFEKEKFVESIQLPDAFDKKRKKCAYTDIGVYKGCLAFFCLEWNKEAQKRKRDEEVVPGQPKKKKRVVPEALEVWVMNKYGVTSSWELKFVIRSHPESWPNWTMEDPVKAVKFFDDGKILVCHKGRFGMYDVSLGLVQWLERERELFDENMHPMCFDNLSFASLKEIVGSNSEVVDCMIR